MTPDELKDRTKTFGIAIVELARELPADVVTSTIVRQLVKSGTAVGANYWSSCRAKSRADFISKMTVAEEEADETIYWLEMLVGGRIVVADRVRRHREEAEQLVRIFVASINTARRGTRGR
ncbi:MAG TPA: four helix bundle protein [Vicinamibacterales bacterium]